MDVVADFQAHPHAAEPVQVGEGTLDHLAFGAELGAVFQYRSGLQRPLDARLLTVAGRVTAVRGYAVRMDLTKRTRNVLTVAALYVVVVLVLRFSGSGMGWWTALMVGLVVTPLAVWMRWLRRRSTERAIEFGRRHGQSASPEDRHRRG
ncbi:hypothetical protein [Streptomyces sp. NBC_00696]|uniref:hypothetical protein n=1 Tax=Streptomyces sp. NBC_00696 TaxID=2903672 RepID=UPI002E33F24D|nr:hypothetical protein [Streptomyces sp. NBC_00696]